MSEVTNINAYRGKLENKIVADRVSCRDADELADALLKSPKFYNEIIQPVLDEHELLMLEKKTTELKDLL